MIAGTDWTPILVAAITQLGAICVAAIPAYVLLANRRRTRNGD